MRIQDAPVKRLVPLSEHTKSALFQKYEGTIPERPDVCLTPETIMCRFAHRGRDRAPALYWSDDELEPKGAFFAHLIADAQRAQREAQAAAEYAAATAERAMLAWRHLRDATAGRGPASRGNRASARARAAARDPGSGD